MSKNEKNTKVATNESIFFIVDFQDLNKKVLSVYGDNFKFENQHLEHSDDFAVFDYAKLSKEERKEEMRFPCILVFSHMEKDLESGQNTPCFLHFSKDLLDKFNTYCHKRIAAKKARRVEKY